MTTSVDIINSTVPGLRNTFEDAFSTYNPFVKALLTKMVKEPTTGPYIEFNILTGGPGRVTNLYGGAELLYTGKANIVEKGNEYPMRWDYSFGITGKDIDEIEDAKDNVVKKGKIADLLQANHLAGITDVASGFAQQFFMGNFSAGTNTRDNGSKGMVSLNGNTGVGYYSQSSGTARTGILEFAAPASQTGTVHNIPSKGAASGAVDGWYNQYSVVTGSGDRRSVLRSTKSLCDRQGADRGASIDFMFSDPESRAAYVSDLTEHTMYGTVESGKDPVTVKAREGLVFGGDKRCLWFDDDHIDITDSTCFPGAAAEGVTYMLSSEDWRLFSTTREKMFTWRKMVKNPFQDGYIQEMLFHFNMYCISRRTQAVVVGTAR